MATWKNLRYQITNAAGETVGESRYYRLTVYLWVNMKDRESMTVTDTYKNKTVDHETMLRAYQMEVKPGLPDDAPLEV